jgi:hypothetical protein
MLSKIHHVGERSISLRFIPKLTWVAACVESLGGRHSMAGNCREIVK